MGFLRLFLAILVVLGHMDINFFGRHLAVSAVVVFYVLAGHVVSRLWRDAHETNTFKRAIGFYRDRALRIFPLYLTVMLFASVLWFAGAQSIFISQAPSIGTWVSNLLVIPLNYYMFSGIDGFTLVPPAWSLGAELQFYLLVPLLLSFRTAALGFGIVTFAVYVLAQTGVLNADHYGYRLLAGVGFIFLLGTLVGRSDINSRFFLWGTWLASVVYSIYLLSIDSSILFNLDVALGFAFGLPVLQAFLNSPKRGLFQSLQRRAGEISYGVFLFHFPVIWLLQLFGYEGKSTVFFVVLISSALAWLAHTVIERPVWRRLRPVIKSVDNSR